MEPGSSTMVCPYCDHANVVGSDSCDECGHSLTGFHPPPPANSVERALVRDRVEILQPRTPIVAEASMPVRQVLKMMVDYRIGCVLIVREGKPIGVFTERDATIKLNTRYRALGDEPVSEFMTPHPQTLDSFAKIAFAVHRMDVGSYRHLPIVDQQGRATGIISVRDILRYMTQKMNAHASA